MLIQCWKLAAVCMNTYRKWCVVVCDTARLIQDVNDPRDVKLIPTLLRIRSAIDDNIMCRVKFNVRREILRSSWR